jgi:hypothetical protein
MRRFGLLALLSIFLALPLAAQTTTGSYTITINPAPLTLSPSSGALANGTVGAPYSATIAISGGIAPYTEAVSSGALPAGLTAVISGSTLTISGTPTTSGTASFVITVASAGSTAKIQMKVDMQVAKNESPKLPVLGYRKPPANYTPINLVIRRFADGSTVSFLL